MAANLTTSTTARLADLHSEAGLIEKEWHQALEALHEGHGSTETEHTLGQQMLDAYNRYEGALAVLGLTKEEALPLVTPSRTLPG